MGILSRISKILEANVNSLLERAEDPALVLEQAIADMKEGREEARTAIIEAKTEMRLTEKRRDAARGEARDHELKAMRALEMGDEALARRILELKLAADSRAEAEDGAGQSHQATIAQLEAAEREIDRRLKEMPAKRAAILARKATAEARGARLGAASKAKDTVAGALEAFERMEVKVTRAEVEAEVRSGFEPVPLDLRALEAHAADEALRQLKAKMAAQLGPGKDRSAGGPPAEGSAVDDSLAALKAKLKRE